ncbi:probable dolichyl pyrophosphate Glc1Man9GlcNAc2 alpha-1,3-glucosyltransferase [Aplysia californica]|uniref:Alpha-1,3-glucosyltransferase n=1 Tax=Aplysia californica TaxID=6500 RepID=A0ABM0JBQ8_APLCA|nr:probable dolichyl pyrophosphate Glc1Man9GlcNAc2 alpha-1,3-glucosyltransferase [Aplysia californica]
MAVVWTLAAAATLVKLLFIPGYRSTDFEVHRNWLAITHSLPMRKWYTEDTSEWTLDYPPFFAAFEFLLSCVAQFFDAQMLIVNNLKYASERTILFQRLSVIFTDFVYFYAVNEFYKNRLLFAGKNLRRMDSQPAIIPALLIFNVGLFIVDHIHFQYNGILFGILLLSLVRITQNRVLEGAFWFAVLLNMKHIYMYVAPAYFVYLLRSYCFTGTGPVLWRKFSIGRFASLGAVVGAVFVMSFGPFIYFQQIGQVLSRLFPFKRGLLHAYWAPNFWALYAVCDKVLTVSAVRLGLVGADRVASAAMTGGMVQEYSFVVLPDVPPIVTMMVTVIAMMPSLYSLWVSKDKVSFVRSVVLCAYTSFLFGWHVHEKAVLLMIIPMTLLVIYDQHYAKMYLILCVTGFYSLFPLLFTPFENVLKVLMLLQSAIFAFLALNSVHSPTPAKFSRAALNRLFKPLSCLQLPFLNVPESLYVLGLVPLGVGNSAGLWLLGADRRLPFLPLLTTSVYCSLGVLYSWLLLYRAALADIRAVSVVSGQGEARGQRVKDGVQGKKQL